MSNRVLTKVQIKSEIINLCAGKFRSLGEICESLQANKNTIRSRYLYPMVREKLLIQEHPPGTKASQRYKANNKQRSSK